MSAALVSVIGPPGVGKTSLANALGQAWSARVIHEDYQSNPFLAESYLGRGDLNLPSQLYFLLSRTRQLNRAVWPGEGVVVADYGFCQDRIFAAENLSPPELRIYKDLAGRCEPLVVPPTVLVHLDAPVEELLRRIRGRGRNYESAFGEGFLERMRNAYDTLMAPAGGRLLRVDTTQVDIREPGPLEELMQTIREVL